MFGKQFSEKRKEVLNMIILQTLIPAAALALILVGIWHEEKLIAFEDRIADRLAWLVAQVIVKHRKRKAKKLHAQRTAHANAVAQARRSRMHIVAPQAQTSHKSAYRNIA